MTITRGLKQAYDVQNFTHACLMSMQSEMTGGTNELGKICLVDKDKAAIIAQLGKVWRDAQEQVRIHRGKPLPGSLTHEKVKRGRSRKLMSGGSVMLEDDAIEPESSAGPEGPDSQPT